MVSWSDSWYLRLWYRSHGVKVWFMVLACCREKARQSWGLNGVSGQTSKNSHSPWARLLMKWCSMNQRYCQLHSPIRETVTSISTQADLFEMNTRTEIFSFSLTHTLVHAWACLHGRAWVFCSFMRSYWFVLCWAGIFQGMFEGACATRRKTTSGLSKYGELCGNRKDSNRAGNADIATWHCGKVLHSYLCLAIPPVFAA